MDVERGGDVRDAKLRVAEALGEYGPRAGPRRDPASNGSTA